MFIDSVDIDINFFILVQWDDIIVNCHEPENERKDYSQQTHYDQLLPCQSDSFQNTF